jgi:hypothetical protein
MVSPRWCPETVPAATGSVMSNSPTNESPLARSVTRAGWRSSPVRNSPAKLPAAEGARVSRAEAGPPPSANAST